MLPTASLVQKHCCVWRNVPQEEESAWQGAGQLCPSQIATVAVGLCQPRAPPCSGSVREALQRLAHDGKDRFGQSSLSSMCEERRGHGSWGLEECHLTILEWWVMDSWSGIQDCSCVFWTTPARATSLRVAHLGPALFSSLLWKGEAGSCGASHLGWGGDFDPPPPSSNVFFCSEYRPGLSHSTAAAKACTSAAVLFRSHPPRHWGRGRQMSVLQMETRGTWRAQDFSRPHGSGEQFPQARGTV